VNGMSWGVLEVDSQKPGKFGTADLSFMKGLANMIGVAIERYNVEEELRTARKHQELLTREASHRVKNSLAIVSSMLALQKNRQRDPAIGAILTNAQHRIETVAAAHDLLWQGQSVGMIDLADMISKLCETLDQTAPQHSVDSEMQSCIVEADTGIPAGLLVNELVTNAIKYAYCEGGGSIAVRGCAADDGYKITVRDEGIGFPADFESLQSAGLGLRLVRSLGQQLNAEISFSEPGRGGTVEIVLPLPDKQPTAL
jgi:two-component sensor histidine kinase